MSNTSEVISFTLHGETEMKALRMAHAATSDKDDPRYYLQGVCFDAAATDADGQMPLVGTNGHMLVKNMVKLVDANGVAEDQQYIFMIDGAVPKQAYTAKFTWYRDPLIPSTVSFWRLLGKKAMKTCEITRFETPYPRYQQIFDSAEDDLSHGDHSLNAVAFDPVYVGRLAAAVTDRSAVVNSATGVEMKFGLSPTAPMKLIFHAMPDAEVILMPIRPSKT